MVRLSQGRKKSESIDYHSYMKYKNGFFVLFGFVLKAGQPVIQAFLFNALFVRPRRRLSALKLIYEHIHIETSVGLNTFKLDVGYMKLGSSHLG